MCGIYGYVGKPKNDLPQFLYEGLKRLEYRGYDSSGIALSDGKGVKIYKKAGKLDQLEKVLPSSFPSSLGLGHTRWATHGGVTDENAHPHYDCSQKIAVVHNGIIENYQEIKRELLESGHQFRSDTDTEVFAHLVEEKLRTHLKIRSGLPSRLAEENPSGLRFSTRRVEETAGFGGNQFANAVRAAFLELDGLNAVAVLSPDAEAIVAFRNGSPLVVGISGDGYFLGSDIPAFLPYTKRVVFIEDGEGVVMEKLKIKNEKLKMGIRKINAKLGKERPYEIKEIEWSAEEAQKGEYPHFLIKEIHEQPETLLRIASAPMGEVNKISRMIKKAFGTYLVGCGTAYHATLAGTYFFSEIAKRHVNSAFGSEFYLQEEFLTPKSLLIAASQSGETMDTLEAVRVAGERGSKVVGMVNVPGSSLMRQADGVVMLKAGPEKAVISTKAYLAKLAHFLLLAYTLARKQEEGINLIKLVGINLKENLSGGDLERQILGLAKRLKNAEHIYLIGRGLNYPTALEGALKIKETSYLHAEGFAGGELKHGVIALIEGGPPATPEPARKDSVSGGRSDGGRGTPCIVFVANDEAKPSVLSNAMELKSRGGYIIGVSPEGNEIFDEWIPVPDVGVASPLVNVVPMQLLGYYLAVERGLDPDKPRNLAKSVTVK